MIRWLWENLGTLLLALVLSFTVWVVAVNTEDPLVERPFSIPIVIRYAGLAEDLTVVGDPVATVRITLRAPESVWQGLRSEDVVARVDLQGLGAGTYQVPVELDLLRRPAQVVAVEPVRLSLTLEPASSVTLPVQVVSLGEPAIGSRVTAVRATPDSAVVRGPSSSVARIIGLRAEIDVTGWAASGEDDSPLEAFDREGRAVEDVQITPAQVRARVEIEQLGGYRSVAVIPLLIGQVKSGYRVTNITVSPTLVTVVSSDPQAIDLLPGFVETVPISLTGVSTNLEQQTPLNLPEGFSVVGDSTVLVQVSIAPIESSITISRRLEIRGLRPGLFAQPSPLVVSVILTGPLPTLEQLLPEEVRVVLDLTGLGAGTYPISPQVIDLPVDVVIETVLPDVIEVTIRTTPPPTSTPTS